MSSNSSPTYRRSLRLYGFLPRTAKKSVVVACAAIVAYPMWFSPLGLAYAIITTQKVLPMCTVCDHPVVIGGAHRKHDDSWTREGGCPELLRAYFVVQLGGSLPTCKGRDCYHTASSKSLAQLCTCCAATVTQPDPGWISNRLMLLLLELQDRSFTLDRL